MHLNKIVALKKKGYKNGYEGIATFKKNGKKIMVNSIFMVKNKADYLSAAEYHEFVGKVRRVSLKTLLRRWKRHHKRNS